MLILFIQPIFIAIILCLIVYIILFKWVKYNGISTTLSPYLLALGYFFWAVAYVVLSALQVIGYDIFTLSLPIYYMINFILIMIAYLLIYSGIIRLISKNNFLYTFTPLLYFCFVYIYHLLFRIYRTYNNWLTLYNILILAFVPLDIFFVFAFLKLLNNYTNLTKKKNIRTLLIVIAWILFAIQDFVVPLIEFMKLPQIVEISQLQLHNYLIIFAVVKLSTFIIMCIGMYFSGYKIVVYAPFRSALGIKKK